MVRAKQTFTAARKSTGKARSKGVARKSTGKTDTKTCTAKTKTGGRCSKLAMADMNVCSIHSKAAVKVPKSPKKAAKAKSFGKKYYLVIHDRDLSWKVYGPETESKLLERFTKHFNSSKEGLGFKESYENILAELIDERDVYVSDDIDYILVPVEN